MCESPESVTCVWGLFVIMDILQAIFVLVIIDIPFRVLRHGLPKLKDI